MRLMETEHVSIERLREIATNDELMFTQDELNHIKVCADCFELWAQLIKQVRFERAARTS